jgi:hypothetical protein
MHSIQDRIRDGFDFEEFIQNLLEQTIYDVLCEKEVRSQLGKDITAIDHLLNKQEYTIAFQDKWRETKNTISDINHFILCVNKVAEITKKPCYGIYLSQFPNTGPAQMAFDYENKKKNKLFMNIYSENQDYIYKELMQFLYSNGIYFYDTDGALQMIGS